MMMLKTKSGRKKNDIFLVRKIFSESLAAEEEALKLKTESVEEFDGVKGKIKTPRLELWSLIILFHVKNLSLSLTLLLF